MGSDSIPILALFVRALREENRSRYTYAARFGLVAIILFFLWMTSQSSGWTGAPGLQAFVTILGINFFCITIGGLSYFASSITEEKEEQTLGLLRMTNLNALSILLGKSTSRILGALFLLVAQLPFTLLAVSLGGLSMTQVFAAYATLVSYTVLLGCVALFFSVISPKTAVAALMSAAMLFLFFFGPWLWKGVAALLVHWQWVARDSAFLLAAGSLMERVREASAFTRISEIMQTGFAGPVAGFQVFVSLGLSAVFFIVAWWRFEPAARRDAGAKSHAAASKVFPRRRATTRRAGARALFWKDFQLFTGGWKAMVIKTAVLLIFVFAIDRALLMANGGRREWSATCLVVGSVMLMLGFLEMALMLSRIFRLEVKWQTLSSLATLPVSLGKIAQEKVLVCLASILPSLILSGLGFFVAMVSSDISDGVWEGIIKGGFLSVSEGLFLLHLIVFMSLVMKRGGFAVSLIIFYGGNMVLGAVFVFGGPEGVLGLGFLSLFLSAMLIYMIGQKLEALAASD